MNLFSILLLVIYLGTAQGKCGVPRTCQCPEIPDAVNGRLGEIETTKYLSHRATFSTDLKISATCEVTVNISGSTVDNFFLMFVRDPEPPLFFRRFTKSTDKQALVTLTDLQCLKDGDKYSWFQNSVRIADSFEVTLMSDEECGCEKISEIEIGAEKIDGTCGAYDLECASNTPVLSDLSGFSVITPLETETTVAETTCVHHSWYYNGYKVDSPTFTCFIIPLEDAPLVLKKPEMKSFVAHCPCTYFLQTINATDEFKKGPAWPGYVEKYRISEANQQMNSVQGIPDIDETTCRVSLSCPDNKKLVVWSLNNEPMTYSSGENAVLQCASLSASSMLSGRSVKDWWINGVLALNIVYTCYD